MTDVFFIPLSAPVSPEACSAAGERLMTTLVEGRPMRPGDHIPVKVHFGEKGNRTFLPPSCYDGVIDVLAAQQVRSSFIETNALYSGSRMRASDHVTLAQEHGFRRLPIQIADGEEGGDYTEVEIPGKHFQRCMIGRAFSTADSVVVISHFKGHRLAGFGGALKQLAMGFASRGGKLAQHVNGRPSIRRKKCTRCGACARYCPVDAIRLVNDRYRIDHNTCIGCAGCMSACRSDAIFFSILRAVFVFRSFTERLAEYALAAQKGKQLYYVTFVMSLTPGCDCEGKPMTPVQPDLGVLASLDPVAIDQAALDLLDQRARRRVFRRGRHTLAYAEKLGVGSRHYRLVTLEPPAVGTLAAAGVE